MKKVKPPVGYYGGKSRVAEELDKIIQSVENVDIYVEPFIGGGSVLYAKKKHPIEVINDLNPNVVMLHESLQNGEEIQACDMTPDRDKFDNAVERLNNNSGALCDFMYVNAFSYNGTTMRYSPTKANKCSTRSNPKKCNITRKKTKPYQKRLEGVIIENDDYRNIIDKYDSPHTVMYLDPPYTNQAAEYKTEQGPVDPEVVAEATKNRQSKIITSFDDHPRVRKAFSDPQFHILPISFMNTAGTKQIKQELLITNFPTSCKWEAEKKEMRC